MISSPDNLPDDPSVLKQPLAQLLAERTVDKGHIVDLQEQIKLLRTRLLSRKSEQTVEPNRLINHITSMLRWHSASSRRDERMR